jgi:predicted MPP superfamily phosphohydrolase
MVAGLGLALDAFWLEPSSLRLSRYDIPVEAPLLRGLKIAVISDVHAGAPFIDGPKIDRVVDLANGAQPDLVLLTGDYVITHVLGGRHMSIEEIVAHLRRLHAPLGVYAVIGNHDRWENAGRIALALGAAGIPVLENANTILPSGQGMVALAGIGDFYTQASDAETAVSGLPLGASTICFTHSPDVFPNLPRQCAVAIAGHTHGGQVNLPVWGRLVVPSNYGQRYAAGLVREGGRSLFISSGIGTSIIPVRLRVPPEVSLLQFR